MKVLKDKDRSEYYYFLAGIEFKQQIPRRTKMTKEDFEGC